MATFTFIRHGELVKLSMILTVLCMLIFILSKHPQMKEGGRKTHSPSYTTFRFPGVNGTHFLSSFKIDSSRKNVIKESTLSQNKYFTNLVNFPDTIPEPELFSFPGVNESYILNVLTLETNRLNPVPFEDFKLKFKSMSFSKTEEQFLPPMISENEMTVMLYLLQVAVRACIEHGVVFMLNGGTLLGSYRHHGMIPWDEDIDIWVNSSQKEIFKKALIKNSGILLGVYIPPKSVTWKIYWKNSNYTTGYRYLWPYLDIFFWTTNEKKVFETTAYWAKDNFDKSDVFPLSLRPYHGALLPMPCKTKAVLEQYYKNFRNVCALVHGYSHRYERHTPRKFVQRPISCKNVYDLFNFVQSRWKSNDVKFEECVQNGQPSTVVAFTSPCGGD